MVKFIKSAGWLFAGLMLVTSGAYAQETGYEASQLAEPESQKPVDSKAGEKILRDAEALMQAGRPADAYKLLEPFEFDLSGEVRFDYLIGIAALDSGKPDKATLAFERVLAVEPDYAGARLDMARAYYQLGDLPRAKTEFETVLNQNPTEAARVTIQNYLDRIAGQQSGKQTVVTGYVEGRLGRDNNVNSAAEQSSVTSIATQLNSNAVEVANNYFGVAAGGEVNHSMNSNWGLYAGVDMSQRDNNTLKSFNTFNLDGHLGVTYDNGSDRLRLGAVGEQHSLGGVHDRDTSGLNAEWRQYIDDSTRKNIFAQYLQYRYVDPAMQFNDINQLAVGVGWLHVLGDTKSTLSGSWYLGEENDVGPTTTVYTNGGRTDGAESFGGFRVGAQAAIGETTKLFISAGGQIGIFSNTNPTISSKRFDSQYDLMLGANWYWDKVWTLRPQLTHFRNMSNVDAYSYDRTDISLTVRRNFK